MKSKELFRLNIGLQSLAIFRNLLKDPVIAALREYLEDLETGETARSVSRYAGFVSAFYAAGTPIFSRYVERIVGDDENPCIRLIGRGETPSPEMARCVAGELEILQAVASLTPSQLRQGLDWDGYLPETASMPATPCSTSPEKIRSSRCTTRTRSACPP